MFESDPNKQEYFKKVIDAQNALSKFFKEKLLGKLGQQTTPAAKTNIGILEILDNQLKSDVKQTNYYDTIKNNDDIRKLLVELNSLFISKDFNKAYIDMGQISFLKLYQEDFLKKKKKKIFFENVVSEKCYLLPNQESNGIINKKYYFKEYTNENDDGTRVKLIYEQLIQVPYFVEKYLIMKMCSQEEPSKIQSSNNNNNNNANLAAKLNPSTSTSPIENIQINKDSIKKLIKIEDQKNNKDFEEIKKDKKKEFDDVYDFNSDFSNLEFKYSGNTYSIFLPISSFKAMLKPSNLRLCQYKEDLRKKSNVKKQEKRKVIGYKKVDEFKVQYQIDNLHSLYTLNPPTYLSGTIRYIYDTISQILYFLFSDSDSECGFIKTYTILQKESSYEFNKNYGLYKGLSLGYIRIIYIMTIYIEYLNYIVTHLMDLIFLTKQLANTLPDLFNSYKLYYKNNYKQKKNKPTVVRSTPPAAAAPAAPAAAATQDYDVLSFYLKMYNNFSKKINNKIVEKNELYKNFVNFDQIDITTKDQITNLRDNSFLNTKFKYEVLSSEIIQVIKNDTNMKKYIDNNNIKDDDMPFLNLMYILYYDYHDQKLDLKTIEKIIFDLYIKKIDLKNVDIDGAKPLGINEESNNNKNIFVSNSKSLQEYKDSIEITFLDYIDYYSFNYNIIDTKFHLLIENPALINHGLNPTYKKKKEFDLNKFFGNKNFVDEGSGGTTTQPDNVLKAIGNDVNQKPLYDDSKLIKNIDNIFEYVKSDFKDTNNLKDVNPTSMYLTLFYINSVVDTNFIQNIKNGNVENEKKLIIKHFIQKNENHNELNKNILKFIMKFKNKYQNFDNYNSKFLDNKNIKEIPLFDIVDRYFKLGFQRYSDQSDFSHFVNVLSECMFIIYSEGNTKYYNDDYLNKIKKFFSNDGDGKKIFLGKNNENILKDIDDKLQEIIKLNQEIKKLEIDFSTSKEKFEIIKNAVNDKKNDLDNDDKQEVSDNYFKDAKYKILGTDNNKKTFIINTKKKIKLKHLPLTYKIDNSNFKEKQIILKNKVQEYNKLIYDYFEIIYFYKSLIKFNMDNDQDSPTTSSSQIKDNKKFPCQFLFLYHLSIKDKNQKNEEFIDFDRNIFDLESKENYNRRDLFDYSVDDSKKINKNYIFNQIIKGDSIYELKTIAENTILKELDEFIQEEENTLSADPTISTGKKTETEFVKKNKKQILSNMKNLNKIFKVKLLDLCTSINIRMNEYCFLVDEEEFNKDQTLQVEIEQLVNRPTAEPSQMFN